MIEILGFLSRYELPIYIILGFLAIICGQRMIRAWQEWRSSIFGLEKDHAQRRFSASASLLALIVSLAIVVFILVSFVFPSVPVEVSLVTPTMDVLAGGALTEEPGNPTDPTMVAIGTTAPQEESGGCISTQIEWLFPREGDEISGTVELVGTVNIPTIGFYKYEFAPAGSDNWMTIAAGNQPKFEEVIGVWNTEELIPGDYQLRLVVTDSLNNTLPACIVRLSIETP